MIFLGLNVSAPVLAWSPADIQPYLVSLFTSSYLECWIVVVGKVKRANQTKLFKEIIFGFLPYVLHVLTFMASS